jgi:hypothetical protein
MSDIKTQKINNVVVKKVPLEKEKDDRPILGFDLIPELHANIFIVAQKMSGKTTLVYRILRACALKNFTKVIIFCNTIHCDDTWLAIVKMLESRGISVACFTELIENKKNILADWMEEKDKKKLTEESGPQMSELQALMKGITFQQAVKEVKEKKAKYRAPEYIIVFDDFSNELKDPAITKLMKQNRHYKSKVIISSQWAYDIQPSVRKQIQIWILFAGIPDDKLEKLHSQIAIPRISTETFVGFYHFCTSERYSFMFIQVGNFEYRKNFNELILIKG